MGSGGMLPGGNAFCDATTGLCPAGQTCAYFDEAPSHGLMSFDSVGVAFISLLQAITFDDWTVAMYALMESLSPYVVVYFLLIVVLGGFFVINLFLAVIFEEVVAADPVRQPVSIPRPLGPALLAS